MNELRKDYLLDRWVIIAKERGKRPSDFKKKAKEPSSGICYFCPGNEHTTPPEITRVEEDGKWVIRVFPNKYPAVSCAAGEKCEVTQTSKPAYGNHEVIVETPDHKKNLSDLTVKHLARVLEIIRDRMRENLDRKSVDYVMVFKNSGKDAGASLSHPHFQLISLPHVPALVKMEADAAKKYKKEKGVCPYCELAQKEMKGERAIWEDEHTAAFAPYASRFPFEVWIVPKKHARNLEELDEAQMRSLANTLKKVVALAIENLDNTSYNLYFHVSPEGDDFHFHIEFGPKLATLAGFELGSDMYINVVSPEEAAKYYRESI